MEHPITIHEHNIFYTPLTYSEIFSMVSHPSTCHIISDLVHADVEDTSDNAENVGPFESEEADEDESVFYGGWVGAEGVNKHFEAYR